MAEVHYCDKRISVVPAGVHTGISALHSRHLAVPRSRQGPAYSCDLTPKYERWPKGCDC